MEGLAMIIEAFNTLKNLLKSFMINIELDKDEHNLLKRLTTHMEAGSECLRIVFNIKHSVRFIPLNKWRV